MPVEAMNIGDLYIQLISRLMRYGKNEFIQRTGEKTKEITNQQVVLHDCQQNLFGHPMRNLNYRFLVAEWLWIIAGREDVGTLAYYNSQMAKFSDDGQILAGAYGKRLKNQWEYLIRTLQTDPSSRQAVASIWTPCPEKSRDIPCTISLQLLIREDRLHGTFNMRSSDAWLGIPPDVYSFSQIVNVMAGQLGITPGSLTMNLGSSHLYERDWEKAEAVGSSPSKLMHINSPLFQPMIPNRLFNQDVPRFSVIANSILREDSFMPFEEPWVMYAKALRSGSSDKCLEILRTVL